MSVAVPEKGKKVALKRRHARIRKRTSGTPERPHPVVIRPNRHTVAQMTDDTKDIILASASTLQVDFAGFEGTRTKVTKKVGELITEKAKAAGITAVVFDRGGNKYAGHVAAVTDSARERGLTL